jgi:RNA polymerase sigma-70 factor (ECF subfamily)
MRSPITVDRVTEAWREHRPYLVDLAFRMLGDIGEAEDVVQEAFSRLLRSDVTQIEDARGWLIVVTTRLCLDQIRSARWRRQRPQELSDGDPRLPAAGAAFGDPADRITLDDSVQLALLVVLERLTPAERVVFVLHDLFQFPFDTVAETVGRSASTCRQLARRARQKVQSAEGPGRFEVMAPEHRRLTERFMAACATGDLDDLLQVLDPQVSGRVDILARLVISGAERVARNLLIYVGGPDATLVSSPAGGRPVLLGFKDRELIAVLVLTVDNDRITEIHAIADPAKLDFVRNQLGRRS